MKAVNLLLLSILVIGATGAYASGASYEVKITNLTKSTVFTPILVAAHHDKIHLFEVGKMASEALSAVAEGGDTSGVAAMFTGYNDQVKSTEGLLGAGESTTVTFEHTSHRTRFTLASMLLPTNDAFFAAQSIRAPRAYKTRTLYLRAYDAGSETNDELCLSIPGPQCGGEPFSPNDQGEGYVYVHSGIHGIGDLSASEYTWNNPVVKVVIKRVK